MFLLNPFPKKKLLVSLAANPKVFDYMFIRINYVYWLYMWILSSSLFFTA